LETRPEREANAAMIYSGVFAADSATPVGLQSQVRDMLLSLGCDEEAISR